MLLTLLLALAGHRRGIPASPAGISVRVPERLLQSSRVPHRVVVFLTGNLRGPAGHLFGYELTFFRHGIDRGKPRNVWHVDDVWFAHFAMSDVSGRKFVHTERFNRSGARLRRAPRAPSWAASGTATGMSNGGSTIRRRRFSPASACRLWRKISPPTCN